jgi:hypothetical protein
MKRMIFIIALLSFGIIFSACMDKPTKESLIAHSPTQKVIPTSTFPPYRGNDLDRINQKVVDSWKALQQEFQIAIMSSGLGKDHIEMEIREYGDFELSISQEEIVAIKKTLFKKVGKEFPLKLDVIPFDQAGYISGKIEKIDKASVLIVNKQIKNGNTQDPQATFVSLTKDGKLYYHGKPEVQAFDVLKVGQEVRAWLTGVTLASYPGMSSALKIEVMED